MGKKIIEIIENQIKQFSLDNDYIKKSEEWINENNVILLQNCIKKMEINKMKLPTDLFALGDVSLLKKMKIGIVGARKCNIYGKAFIEKFLKKIKGYNFVTISGFALGIDSYTHNESINNNIPTIAITGNGFAINYPAQNKKLKTKIVNCGLILSEFSPYIKPYKANFIRRNFIIAYLSDILIIVQGNKYSGTLSTLNWALKLNKKIYALPGDIDKELSYTPNYAIANGAKIIHSIENIDFIKQLSQERKNVQLKEKELKIYSTIKNGATIDFILKTLPFEKSEILSIITRLELEGIIKRDINNKFYIMEDIDE